MLKKFSLLILLIVLSFSSLVNAQNENAVLKPMVDKETFECKLNEIFFQCPKEFAVILDGNNINGLFLAKDQKKEYGYSIFVISPKSKFDEQQLMDEVAKTSFKNLYPKDSQNYRWKDIGFVNNKALSKFELGKKARYASNHNHLLLFLYRHISIKNKDIFVGYVSETVKGKDTEFLFNAASSVGEGPGCQSSLSIINSITGENNSNEYDPCALTIKLAK